MLPKNGKIDYVSASLANKSGDWVLSAQGSHRKNVKPATSDIRLLGRSPNQERLRYLGEENMNHLSSMNQNLKVPYQCPESNKALHAKDDWLCDDSGEKIYPIYFDVPIILKYASAESSEDLNRLNTLIKLSDSVGFLEAIYQVHGKESVFTGYVTDASRCVFLDILPIKPESKILEIGSGLGQFTPQIAHRCEHVTAIEVVQEQAILTLKRCLELGCKNVSVAASGDACFLPFKANHFDGVIINLVLEWCGMREDAEQHEVLQRRMLSEIHRVLKPGGFVFISTKNRYALRYIMGQRDGHAYKMRFGNALPRWVMNLMLRLRGKKRPIGRLHSYSGFIRLIRESGFTKIKPYWAIPDMRRPKQYISVDTDSVRTARQDKQLKQASGKIIGRIMKIVPASFVKYVAYGNVAVAYKTKDQIVDSQIK